MEGYLPVIFGAALIVVAIVANRMHRKAPNKVPSVWSPFKRKEQLRVGRYILIGMDALLVEGFERYSTSSLAPAFRYRLTLTDGSLRWLHLQAGPGGRLDIWLLEVTPWVDITPMYGTEELVYGLKGVFDDAIWSKATCYPNDGIEPGAILRYGRFFWSPARSIVTALPLAGAPRDMLSFEWNGTSEEPTVLYGTGIDPASILVY